MAELSRSQIPPGGWQWYESATGWSAPTPIASTHDQTVVLIQKHRLANPAIVAKHNLPTDFNSISVQLVAFNRARLGMPSSETAPDPPAPGSAPKAARCCGA